MSRARGADGRAWAVALVAALALAAALIIVPRPLLFEPTARDACEARGAGYVGLASGSGRYADPVPEGARCLAPGNPSPIELEVRFFADGGAADAVLAWLYRLACVLLPLGFALALASGLAKRGHSRRQVS